MNGSNLGSFWPTRARDDDVVSDVATSKGVPFREPKSKA